MTKRIFVEPVEARSEMIDVLVHPIDGPLRAWGSFWSYDAFTCRMIMDGVIRATGEVDTTPERSVGPEAFVQQRRVSKPRPRMRIHNPPTVR